MTDELVATVGAWIVAAAAAAVLVAGCGPDGHYFRGDAGHGSGGAPIDAHVGSGGAGGTGLTGASGGSPGTGGGMVIGTGGASTGGTGTAGRVGTGGSATGGSGTGGSASGGAGTGGRVGTGGAGTGGKGTGGAATGGAATGGRGTGGAASGGAGPPILSIDFVGGRVVAAGGAGGTSLVPYTPMAATEIAGLKPAANWNAARGPMGNATALKLMDGTATAASVTWNSPLTGANPGIWQNVYPDAPGDVRMMNGYLDPTSTASPATVTVMGLPASFNSRGYDVYVYASGDVSEGQSRTYSYQIGTNTVMLTQNGTSSTAFPGYSVVSGGAGNTVIFRNVTGTSFTLTAKPVNTTTPRAPVNGLQIVSLGM